MRPEAGGALSKQSRDVSLEKAYRFALLLKIMSSPTIKSFLAKMLAREK